MNNTEILNSIKEIMVNELAMEESDIFSEKKLQDMGIDSIQLMTLIVYIEDRFEIEIEFDESWPLEITSMTLDEFITHIQELF